MLKYRHSTLWTLTLVFVLLALAGAACAPPAAPVAQQPQEQSPAEPAAEAKPTIKLAENPWSGSAVNIAVAKILLEEQLGYPVEVVTLDENAQWAALASGDLHASLEVWPSGHAENVAEYIDKQKVVEYGGVLGPVGKIAWYTPKYMIDQHAEFATWEGFKDPELAKLYATAETGDMGQFLAGDPSWVQYEEQIIPSLGLNLQVVVAGSEEAILAALDSAYSRQDPVLFYFWTPHSVHARYELAEVALPPYSDECYAKAEAGGVDCAYPSDDLFKIFWSELSDYAPEAYQFLKNFNYTTQDQIEMVAAVELEGKTAAEAAQAWIDANQDTWKAWLP